jgi:hypothetical protein
MSRILKTTLQARFLSLKNLCIIFSATLFLCLITFMHFIDAAAESCHRIDREGAAKERVKKKAELKTNGIPEEYVQLVDRLPDCVGCIKYAPDTVHIQIVENNGNWISFEWNPTSELIARNDLRKGTIKAFYIIHSARACNCCGQPEYDERSDWNTELDINTDLVIAYTDPKKLGPDPRYVRELPEDIGLKQIKEPYIKMPRQPRPALAKCEACSKNAKNVNISYNLVYALEKKIRELKIEKAKYAQIHDNQARIIKYSNIRRLPDDMIKEASALKFRAKDKFNKLNKEIRTTQNTLKLACKNRDNELAKAKQCEEKKCDQEKDTAALSDGDLVGTWKSILHGGFGVIMLKKSGKNSYEGTYSNTYGKAEGRLRLTINRSTGKGDWSEGEGRKGTIYDVHISEDRRTIKGKWKTTKRDFGTYVKDRYLEWHKQ